jgi:hypothetical protein
MGSLPGDAGHGVSGVKGRNALHWRRCCRCLFVRDAGRNAEGSPEADCPRYPPSLTRRHRLRRPNLRRRWVAPALSRYSLRHDVEDRLRECFQCAVVEHDHAPAALDGPCPRPQSPLVLDLVRGPTSYPPDRILGPRESLAR